MAQITAGIKLSYQVETAPGSRPSSTWTEIAGAVEIPEIGATPDTLETTSLDNLVYKTYIPGLLDTGGVITVTFNDSSAFRTAVGTPGGGGMLGAQSTAQASGLSLWFKISVPSPVNENLAFQGRVSPLGFSGAGPNAVLQAKLNIVATGEPEWTPGQ